MRPCSDAFINAISPLPHVYHNYAFSKISPAAPCIDQYHCDLRARPSSFRCICYAFVLSHAGLESLTRFRSCVAAPHRLIYGLNHEPCLSTLSTKPSQSIAPPTRPKIVCGKLYSHKGVVATNRWRHLFISMVAWFYLKPSVVSGGTTLRILGRVGGSIFCAGFADRVNRQGFWIQSARCGDTGPKCVSDSRPA